LNLNKKGRANVRIAGGKMVVEPVVDLLDLRGSLKTNKKFTPRQVREGFEYYLATRHLK
jgi:hypothetical protein